MATSRNDLYGPKYYIYVKLEGEHSLVWFKSAFDFEISFMFLGY